MRTAQLLALRLALLVVTPALWLASALTWKLESVRSWLETALALRAATSHPTIAEGSNPHHP